MRPEDLKQQRILYGCLDWGNGHVARSIPLIQQLISQENSIFLWCTPAQELIFKAYGIEATFITKNGFSFQFKGDGNFTKEMSRNAWRFLKSVKSDRIEVNNLVKMFGITVIVSDHSYGLVSKIVPSVFITHQCFLPPKSGWLAQVVHRNWMKAFSAIWIMDDESKRLAGELSKSIESSIYIGWYSRFRNTEVSVVEGRVVVIVSGPEPYAEQFFNEMVRKYSTSELIIISPKKYAEVPSSVRIVNDWLEADREIASAETIVSRNGYTTLMDLQFLNKKAILIPTPGQLEQEYLIGLNENSSIVQ